MSDQIIAQFWTKGDTRCSVIREGALFELRLYTKDTLIALVPCATFARAADLATDWSRTPPVWPAVWS
jgi:hypothetical protein